MGTLYDNELRELQLDFLRDAREKSTEISRHVGALQQKRFRTSFPALLYLAHQLKGSGGSLGFPEISAAAGQLTTQLSAYLEEREQPADQLAAQLTSLADSLTRAVDDAERATSPG